MGLVRKQASYNLILNYLGVFLGFINLVVLFPKFLSVEQFGLTRTLLAITAVYMQFSSFGISRVALRFFNIFTEDKTNNGFLTLITGIPVITFTFLTLVFILFKFQIIMFYSKEATLLIDNLFLCIPMTFFMLMAFVYEVYLQTLKRTVLSTFFRIIVLRLIWLIAALLFSQNIIDFDTFLVIFSQAYFVNFLVLLIDIYLNGNLEYRINPRFFKWRLIKQVLKYCLFSLLSGFTLLAVTKIDILMISGMVGLEGVSVYAIAMYFSSIILIPYESLMKILSPFISNEMKENNMKNVHTYYKESVSNSVLFGGFIFVLIMVNQNSIFSFLPERFYGGFSLVLMLGFSKLLFLFMGSNSLILSLSKYYKFDFVFVIILLGISILSNYILISQYGLIGAAIATTLTMLFYSGIRVVFTILKLKISPFSPELFKAIFGLLVLLVLGYVLPTFSNVIMDLLFKSGVLISIFFLANRYLKVNLRVNKFLIEFENKLLTFFKNK